MSFKISKPLNYYVLYTALVFATASIFVASWAPSKNFCTGSHWKYLNESHMVYHFAEYDDKVLLTYDTEGKSGSYIEWHNVYGYFLLISSLISLVVLYTNDTNYESRKYHLFVVTCAAFYTGWSIWGLILYWGKHLDPACRKYQIGNNLAYVSLEFFSYFNMAFIPTALISLMISIST